MSGFAEAIKYFYQQFILRDLLAYVTPGALLIATGVSVISDPVDALPQYLESLPATAYLVLFGLSYTVGFALEQVGEQLKVLAWYYRERNRSLLVKLPDARSFKWFYHLTESEYDHVKDQFRKLYDFNEISSRAATEAAASAEGKQPDDWRELTRERLSVQQHMAGTNALAFMSSAVLITCYFLDEKLLTPFCTRIASLSALAVLIVLLIIGLLRGHRKHLLYRQLWEEIVTEKAHASSGHADD